MVRLTAGKEETRSGFSGPRRLPGEPGTGVRFMELANGDDEVEGRWRPMGW